MDLIGYAVPVPQGAESLAVEWSTGDHSRGVALPPEAHAATIAVERNRHGAAWTKPNLMC